MAPGLVYYSGLKDRKSREASAHCVCAPAFICARPGLTVSVQASALFAVSVLLVECLCSVLCRFALLFAAEIIQSRRAAGRMLATMLLAALLLAALALATLLLATLLPGLLALLVPALIVSLILRHLELLNEVVEAQ